MSIDDDKKVGYGKPPKQFQFPPGQSGNPKGRPKGRPNMATMYRKAINRMVPIKQNGKTRSISVKEAVIEKRVTDAFNGTADDRRKFTKDIEQLLPEEMMVEHDSIPMLKHEDIMRRFAARALATEKARQKKTPEADTSGEPDQDPL